MVGIRLMVISHLDRITYIPELLNQIYYSSPLHGSIVGYKVNAAVGGGFNIVADRLTPQDKLELYTLERKLNIKKDSSCCHSATNTA
jgi:hypothetical protein